MIAEVDYQMQNGVKKQKSFLRDTSNVNIKENVKMEKKLKAEGGDRDIKTPVVENLMDGFVEVVDLTLDGKTVRTNKKRYEELRTGWNTDNCFACEEDYIEADGCLTDTQICEILNEEAGE